jgi:PilZ domain
MSALPPKAEIRRHGQDDRIGPKGGIDIVSRIVGNVPIATNRASRNTSELLLSLKSREFIHNLVNGRAQAGRHPGQSRLTRLKLHREAAVSLFQVFARFKRTFVERRRSIREQVQIPAWIDACDGSQLRSCAIVDVSESGARIMVSSPALLPKDFWLVLTKDGMKRRLCRMVWCTDTQVGVKYLGAVQSYFFRPALN